MKLVQANKRLFVLPLILLLALINPVLAGKRPTRPKKTAATIVLDKSDLKLRPNQAQEVKAKVLDVQGREIPSANVSWKVIDGPAALVRLNMTNNQDVLITSQGLAEDSVITLRAQSGRTAAALKVQLQNSEPSEIVFPEGKEFDLPVQGHKPIKAYVLDSRRNMIADAEVSWSLADPDLESFVLVGKNVNKDGVNTVEISWLGGKADVKTPSEVKLIARSGNARGVVTINYKAPKLEATKITAEPTSIELRPGDTKKVQIKVLGEDQRVLKVESSDLKAEIVNPDARSYLKVVVADGTTINLLAGYGDDPNSLPPAAITTALLVRVGSGMTSIPITYRRDATKVVWDILPPKIVGANYGRSIMKNYYCIEVVIHNYSGSDVALAGLEFESQIERPNTSYSTVRGSLARRELSHARTLTLAGVDTLGSLMTGFLPFFHNTNHANNFSTFIALTSNPIAKGLERIWKDPVPGEIERFERDVLRDEKIIPNASIFKTKIFVPKRALFKTDDQRRNDLLEVRKELGRLLVFGYKFHKGPIAPLGAAN